MQEIDNIKDFKKWLDDDSRSPATIQDLSLDSLGDKILSKSFDADIFLGCDLSNNLAAHIVKTGGLVIPDFSGFLFKTHRAKLYSPEELFDGFSLAGSYHDSFDYKVYSQYLINGKSNPKNIKVSLARRLHDHSISDALYEQLSGKKVVAIMGGHSLERSEEMYFSIAKIARELTNSGYLIVSGGGPGAMEASHLGAYFATKTMADLKKAMSILKPRPSGAKAGKEYLDKDWLHRAWRVRDAFPLSDKERKASLSIGIPTWLYGHEPPTIFATKIAKYFANSVREDGLVSIAKHGIIFAPGSAGTVQEIFQNHTQNYYGSLSHYSPMLLFGKDYWTKNLPVWPLISKMAKGKKHGELIYLSDSEKEIVSLIKGYDADKYETNRKENMKDKIILWHNPRCSKSRAGLKLLEEAGLDFEIRQYLKQPPTKTELKNLLKKLGMKAKDLIRKREKLFKDLGLSLDDSEDKLIEAMSEHPKLIERPIVIKGDKAALGRPTENIAELLEL